MNEFRDRDRDRQIASSATINPRAYGEYKGLVGGHGRITLVSNRYSEKAPPSGVGMIPYGLRARERRWHREDNIFDSTPAGTDHSLRISGERLGGKRQV
jgi:hypothetical protein